MIAVLILLLACNASAASTASTSAGTEDIPLPEEYDEGFFVTQWESIGIFDKMLDSFRADAVADDSSGTADGSTAYPDYYGGAYIDDSGKLVVLTTDMSDPVINEIRAAAGYDVTVESCPASLNELEGTVDLIVDHFELLREQGIKIATVGKDIKTGKVIVSVIDLDAEKEATIRALVDNEYLEFENTDRGWIPY